MACPMWITGNSVIFSGFTEAILCWAHGGSAIFRRRYLSDDITAILIVTLHYTVTAAISTRPRQPGGEPDVRHPGRAADHHRLVFAAVLGALAGLIYTARQGSLTPLFGASMLLPTFAAAFLGSVTLARRQFHIIGTVIGVYLIETGTTGLLILGAPAYTQQLFAGAVLILATIGARYRRVKES